ncbi:HMCN [Mytilus edulis]|uniref:HMCN n=1 Tax=Mytilus edulis TaxID=6550 RepID=A0A8S3RBR8_MYTED|nr:HMCN [Mytilus edulis]
MKENYKALLQRVDDNEQDIASLRGQKQLLEKELENTRQTFSCEIENLHDVTVHQKLELNDINLSRTTFNETTHKLIHRVNVLDNQYLLPERCGEHINKTDVFIFLVDGKWTAWVEEPCSVTCGVGVRVRHRQCSSPYHQNGGKKCKGNDTEQITCTLPSCLQEDILECYGGWIKREDFGASYCFSNKTLSWDEAQEQCGLQNASLADICSENEDRWLAEYCRIHPGLCFI